LFCVFMCFIKHIFKRQAYVNVSFLGLTPCGLAGRYQRFGGTYCLHLQPRFPETLVLTHGVTTH
jgi:hypothetical protein